MKTKWKKLSKRILSGALALAMMCSILPAGVITASAASYPSYTVNTTTFNGVTLTNSAPSSSKDAGSTDEGTIEKMLEILVTMG